MMILDDAEINRHFSDFENAYFLKIVELLNKNGIVRENLFESDNLYNFSQEKNQNV